LRRDQCCLGAADADGHEGAVGSAVSGVADQMSGMVRQRLQQAVGQAGLGSAVVVPTVQPPPAAATAAAAFAAVGPEGTGLLKMHMTDVQGTAGPRTNSAQAGAGAGATAVAVGPAPAGDQGQQQQTGTRQLQTEQEDLQRQFEQLEALLVVR